MVPSLVPDAPPSVPDGRFALAREHMVQTLAERGIVDRAVLHAMRAVPREVYVPPSSKDAAYEDRALPIAEGQSISQPYIVAAMLQALELQPRCRMLEVGTGTGYSAAVAAQIAREVFTVECRGALAQSAELSLSRQGVKNVHVIHGDGSSGWAENAPYDAISVAAAAPIIPAQLLSQLSVGGRLIMPVGEEDLQRLLLVTRTSAHVYDQRELETVRFVPLVNAGSGSGVWRVGT